MLPRWHAIIELCPISTSDRGRARESMHSRKFFTCARCESVPPVPRLGSPAIR